MKLPLPPRRFAMTLHGKNLERGKFYRFSLDLRLGRSAFSFLNHRLRCFVMGGARIGRDKRAASLQE